MKEYIRAVIGAVMLSGIASVLSPKKWEKYTSLITGLVMICTLISPVSKINGTEIFKDIDKRISDTVISKGEEERLDMIKAELARNINNDIKNRLHDEFGEECDADAEIETNSEGKITGVKAMNISGKISSVARKRLCDVYGVEESAIRYD